MSRAKRKSPETDVKLLPKIQLIDVELNIKNAEEAALAKAFIPKYLVNS